MQTSISGHLFRRIAHVLVIAVFTVALAFPFYWMLITSFKQNVDLYAMQNNPFIFNAKPTLDHLTFLFTQTRFVGWLGNTTFVGVVVVSITLLFSLPVAYSVARISIGWGGRVGIGSFLAYHVPVTLF